MSQPVLLDLSRWQWAVTAAFHIIFPAQTVGTSLFLVFCYGAYMRTHDKKYLRMFRFWRRIFGIGFAIGVVSGIVLTFEFGLNWGPFANAVGPIVGVLIAMEVVTAFFLESGFLGLLIYGDGRVGERTMMVTTCMVAVGTLLSVAWILAANSWMQTPAGYRLVNGQFQAENWLHIIFNPSFLWRVAHMLIGVVVSASWFVAGISAWYLLKRRHLDIARTGITVALGVAVVAVPVQLWVGDNVGGVVAAHQFPKILAMEGNWTSTNTGYNLLVIPQQDEARNRAMLTVPRLGSVIAKDWSGKTAIPGLKVVPVQLRPNMLSAFYGFRIMLYAALMMLAVAMIGVILRLRGRLFDTRWFHRLLVIMAPSGIIAIVAGWVLAETGRQPWIVYGKLLTPAAVSPLRVWPVLTSLSLFVAIYALLIGTYIWYVARVVREGPEVGQEHEDSAPSVAPLPPSIQAPRPITLTEVEHADV